MRRVRSFADRTDAGRMLAERLADLRLPRPVILAPPRGGVPVGAEIARRLNAPLDLIIARKIGAPDQPEFAIGAVAEGSRPEIILNTELLSRLAIARTTSPPPRSTSGRSSANSSASGHLCDEL